MDEFCVVNVRTGESRRCETVGEVMAELGSEDLTEFAVYRLLKYPIGDLGELRRALDGGGGE